MQRHAAPTTGKPHIDLAFNIVALAVQNGHNAAAFRRGYDACRAGAPLPRAEAEAEGWISAFHALCWDELPVAVAVA